MLIGLTLLVRTIWFTHNIYWDYTNTQLYLHRTQDEHRVTDIRLGEGVSDVTQCRKTIGQSTGEGEDRTNTNTTADQSQISLQGK